MKDYQNYLFDLYGTLVDIHTDEESPLLWKRLSVLLAMEGAFWEPEELKTHYGREVARREEVARAERGSGAEIDIGPVIASFYEARGCTPKEEQIERTARFFRILSIQKLRLFPGAEEMLLRLKKAGKKVYLLSNAQMLFTSPELDALRLREYFDGIIISSNEGLKKPDKRLYHLALKRYGLDPARTVMVGNDDQADCWGAAQAGLDSMYVFTEQSPLRCKPLPGNCRLLKQIGDVF